MFSPQVVELAYIGNRPTKTDNVCGTGTVWIGFGDIQKVERKHIPVFLKHPDVWMLGDKFKALNSISEPLTGEQIGGGLKTDSDPAGSTLVGEAVIALQQSASDEAKASSTPEVVFVQAGLADALALSNATAINIAEQSPAAEPEKPAEEKSEKTGDQLAAIKNAILSLEQGNAKHFSATNGVPILSAVKNAAGDEKIVAADVRAAWAELNGKVV